MSSEIDLSVHVKSGLEKKSSTPSEMTKHSKHTKLDHFHINIPENMRKLNKSNVKIDRDVVLGKGSYASVFAGEAPKEVLSTQMNQSDDLSSSDEFDDCFVPLAQNTSTIPVAIKVLDKSGYNTPLAIEALQAEIAVCSEINHPCIINTYGIFEDSDHIYIVMDICQGGQLLSYTKKFGLEEMPKMAPRFLAEVVLSLEHLLSKGYIHRDVKPENILLTQEYHVKLADFGTACKFYDSEKQSFAGTPLYISPETLLTGKSSKTSDLWSLGCIVYELFVGKPPFEGQNSYQVMQAIKETKCKFPPYFPTDAKDLVLRCLEKDPNKRIGNKGYNEIKSHSFFNSINWKLITTECNITVNTFQWNKILKSFLFDNEKVLFTSITSKKKALRKQVRQLVLTDKPRLFYIEPDNQMIKGHIPWSKSLCAEAKSDRTLNIHTDSRVYKFSIKSKLSYTWASKINDTVKRYT